MPIGSESSGATSRSIQIGDNIHNHYQQAAPQKGGIGKLGSALVGAALAAGTGGAGFGLWSMLQSGAETVLTRDADVTAGEPIIEKP